MTIKNQILLLRIILLTSAKQYLDRFLTSENDIYT